ncbi:uncharacterized protein N7477_004834 [Penicillium maclennaniae]|uniref:uncharacterized protein n=1 Tax=Penicillium maclennaniae TaxID=1343394 RepID=UPI0025402D4C|nr:uncharacterized protein N7477_004834 [Penicillium maclennaniae]KAJ5674900.1 hypothetical protein N7477_004834 [Penicillium maclennaniae]
MLVVFNRPQALNAMTSEAQYKLESLFSWYDSEPSLCCAIITGAKTRALEVFHAATAKKSVIAAINGLVFGGGIGIVSNLDLVVAAESARFALPGAERGVVAMAGSLPRIARTIGRPRATELALTGKTITAAEAREWGLINTVTKDGAADCAVLHRLVVRAALGYATNIINNNPDSVIISRAGILAGYEDGSAENASRLLRENMESILNEGESLHEGLKAFAEKRESRISWVQKLNIGAADAFKAAKTGINLSHGHQPGCTPMMDGFVMQNSSSFSR